MIGNLGPQFDNVPEHLAALKAYAAAHPPRRVREAPGQAERDAHLESIAEDRAAEARGTLSR